MSVTLEAETITLEQLIALNQDSDTQIIDGELIIMSGSGTQHHWIARNIFVAIDAVVSASELGMTFFDGLIYLMHSSGLRDSFIPDLSFIRREHFIADFDFKKPYPGVPDFAVEVLSPEDKILLSRKKINLYFMHGTEEVWMVYPDVKEVHQHRADQPDTVRIYTGETRIDTERLFPGVMLNAQKIFTWPAWVIQS